MTKPPAGQGPFQQGERLTAAKLNEWVLRKPTVEVFGEGHSEGGIVAVDGRETMYIRLTAKDSANAPIKYGWKRVSRLENGTWANLTHTGNTTNDYAVEVNNANLPVGSSTVYHAGRSTTTGEWLFQQTGGSGNVEIRSGETVLMILGTYDDYKNCEDVPPSPPTLETGCGEPTTELCVPAYAYAVYSRCGYVWNKVGDTRDFGVWANELNGGTTSAFRRFVIPRWGGDIDPATGLPDPDSDCMGVAFVGSSAGALTCGCPPCLSSPPPDVSLCVRFRTQVRPDGPITGSCAATANLFDENNLWDREFLMPISPVGCISSANDGEPIPFFDFEWQDIDGSAFGCDWGPDVFDPCDPCYHWSRLQASIAIRDDPFANCGGAGNWTGAFSAKDICNLLCNCGDPVKPKESKICPGCPIFLVEESIEIICCPSEIDGGSADAPPPDFVSGYGGGFSFDGGDA